MHSNACQLHGSAVHTAHRRSRLAIQAVAAPEAPAAPKQGAAAKRVKLGSSDLSVSGKPISPVPTTSVVTADGLVQSDYMEPFFCILFPQSGS